MRTFSSPIPSLTGRRPTAIKALSVTMVLVSPPEIVTVE